MLFEGKISSNYYVPASGRGEARRGELWSRDRDTDSIDRRSSGSLAPTQRSFPAVGKSLSGRKNTPESPEKSLSGQEVAERRVQYRDY